MLCVWVRVCVCVCVCVLGREGNVVYARQVYGQLERGPSKATGSQFPSSRRVRPKKDSRDQDKKDHFLCYSLLRKSLISISFFSISSFRFHCSIKIVFVSVSYYVLKNHFLPLSNISVFLTEERKRSQVHYTAESHILMKNKSVIFNTVNIWMYIYTHKHIYPYQ